MSDNGGVSPWWMVAALVLAVLLYAVYLKESHRDDLNPYVPKVTVVGDQACGDFGDGQGYKCVPVIEP